MLIIFMKTIFKIKTIQANREFTSIVIDMMDNENQRVLNSNNNLPQDRVSGYTILQIQQGLRGVKSLARMAE